MERLFLEQVYNMPEQINDIDIDLYSMNYDMFEEVDRPG